MKRVIFSLLLITVVAGATIFATRAYFSSSRTLGANTSIISGDFLIEPTSGDSQTTMNLGDVTGIMPGYITDWVEITITNVGAINGAWFGYFNTGDRMLAEAIYLAEAKMEFLSPESGADWELMDYFISEGTGSGLYGAYYDTLAATDPFGVITLKTWNLDNAMGAGEGVQMGALKPDYMYRFTFKLGFAPKAGNEYQGLTLPLSYTVVATQVDAGALDELFLGNTRLSGPGSNHLDWLNLQLAKQL